MNNNKFKLIILCSMFGVMLLLGVLSFGDFKFSPKEGLSYEDKKRDAKYLIDFLENTYPYFEEVKKETGQDILSNKTKIINSISKTPSDEAFYESISNLLLKFSYGNTQLSYNLDSFGDSFTYMNEDINYKKTTSLATSEKWKPINENYWKKVVFPTNINFLYINGEYYVSATQNPEVHVGDKLIKAEGIPIDKYVEKMPSHKFLKAYDPTYEKYVSHYNLNSIKNKESNIKVTLLNASNEEKVVDMLPFDENKPFSEDGFSSLRNSNSYSEIVDEKELEKIKLVNSFEDGKLLALNLSAYVDINKNYRNNKKNKEELFSLINSSDTLVLDFRGGTDLDFSIEILDYILPKDIEHYNYKIFKKGKVNDKYIEALRSKLNPYIQEVTSPIDSLEKAYPLSKYYIFKEQILKINGENKYNGKVFALHDGSVYSDKIIELLSEVTENSLATVISNVKLYSRDLNYDSMISFTLPNSNLTIQTNSGKRVDINGDFIGNKVVTPQVLITKDIKPILDDLRNGKGVNWDLAFKDRYGSKDEYFNEVLKQYKK
ncbi:hypothetical protein [Clostridium tunisiense]|uniref:hypothetical protein n=1 Tax=Clostridium tunisiense TaxID=219748 RepID=UPI0002D2C1FC|nr:hypothetical protein [Clostridium tunisiense]